MRRTLLPSLLLLALLPASAGAQASIGTTAETRAEWIHAHPDGAPGLDVLTVIAPSLGVASDRYLFSLTGSVIARAPEPEVGLELDSYELTFFPAPWATLRFGRFAYLPGFAEVFSQTNYFSRVDLTRLVRGDLEAASRPGFLAQASAYLGAFYVTASATPFVYPQLLPPADSPWLPDADIPSTLELLPFSSEVYREEIRYAGIDPQVPLDWSRVSYAVEAGGSYRGLDFALLWYNGFDNDPLVQARIVDLDPYESFSVELSPVYRKVTAAGANLLYTTGAVRVWTDASYAFYKRFLTNVLDVERRTTQLAEAPYLSYAAGASWEPRFANAALVLEYAGSHAFGENETLVMPALHSVAAATLQWWLLDYRLVPRLTYVLSSDDWSSALLAGLAWEPAADLSVELSAPLFFGDAASELGQYRGNRFVSAAVRWRF